MDIFLTVFWIWNGCFAAYLLTGIPIAWYKAYHLNPRLERELAMLRKQFNETDEHDWIF